MSQLTFSLPSPPAKKARRKPRRGRPAIHDAGIRHRSRVVLRGCPLHVTMRMRRHVWQLRSRRCFGIIERALWAAVEHDPVTRIVEFSVQSNHIHLIVETQDRLALGRRMQAFSIRVAKRLNRLMDTRGPVFATRYHSRALRTPTQVRHALVYVLQNGRKHSGPTARFTSGWKDPYSSALWFTGFQGSPPMETRPSPTCAAATWMLSVGWRERGGGAIRLDELPRGD